MNQFAFLLFFISTLACGQASLDYKLYSIVIDDYIDLGIEYDEVTSEVLIISKYIPNRNEVTGYGQELLDGEEQILNIALHYDTLKIRLFKDKHIRDGIVTLENEFYETPLLDYTKFPIDTKVIAITDKQFDGYFRTLFGRDISKGWKKFYNKYPGTHGIFEFSKIVYKGNYAIFYIGRHSNGLSGSGDLVILKIENGNWSIVTYVNLWMA